MPLICLKMSPAVPKASIELNQIFAQLQDLVVANIENAKLSSCKSWLESMSHAYIGEGKDPNPALIILSISFFAGRPKSQHKALTDQCLAYLKTLYADDVKIFVGVKELDRDTSATA